VCGVSKPLVISLEGTYGCCCSNVHSDKWALYRAFRAQKRIFDCRNDDSDEVADSIRTMTPRFTGSSRRRPLTPPSRHQHQDVLAAGVRAAARQIRRKFFRWAERAMGCNVVWSLT
jgi:hypothetical protein